MGLYSTHSYAARSWKADSYGMLLALLHYVWYAIVVSLAASTLLCGVNTLRYYAEAKMEYARASAYVARVCVDAHTVIETGSVGECDRRRAVLATWPLFEAFIKLLENDLSMCGPRGCAAVLGSMMGTVTTAIVLALLLIIVVLWASRRSLDQHVAAHAEACTHLPFGAHAKQS